MLNGKLYWLGSHRYLEERSRRRQKSIEQLEAMQEAGNSVVVVGNDSHVCGFITLVDNVRPAAKATWRPSRTGHPARRHAHG